MVRKENKSQNTNYEDSEGNLIQNNADGTCETSLIRLDFVKSALTINPCMVNYFLIHCILSRF